MSYGYATRGKTCARRDRINLYCLAHGFAGTTADRGSSLCQSAAVKFCCRTVMLKEFFMTARVSSIYQPFEGTLLCIVALGGGYLLFKRRLS